MKRERIKICFFSPASYPLFFPNQGGNHGGAELQMYLLANTLSDNKDFQIQFFIKKYQRNKKIKNKNIQLIKTISVKKNENIVLKLLKGIKLFFQLIKYAPDVIIHTNASALAGIIGLYTKLFGKKFIYRTSSLIDVNNDYIKKNGISGKLYLFGLLQANCVITQNKEHQYLLKKNHHIDAKLIKNVFELKDYKSYKKKFILWVSRYHELKNPELFLKLAQEIPEEKFVMICPYNPADYKKWKVLKNKAQNISNLTFIEKVPFAEIQAYFNQAKLFVNTSDYEGFPNTFLQAAQAQTPIISLSVNPDNFIDEYNCGIFCYNDFKQLVEQTKKLLQNPDEINLKGKNAYRYLKENHDINKIGKRFEELILSLF